MSREAYRPEPLGPLRDDGLWSEYQDALGAARTRRDERREADGQAEQEGSQEQRGAPCVRHSGSEEQQGEG